MARQIRIFLWKVFLCRFDIHRRKDALGGTANFCEACRLQINRNAFHEFEVVMKNGDRTTVSAVNTQHAKNLVIYAGDMRIDGATGRPLAVFKVHPDNILSVQKIGS